MVYALDAAELRALHNRLEDLVPHGTSMSRMEPRKVRQIRARTPGA
jgi:hypothetical protein